MLNLEMDPYVLIGIVNMKLRDYDDSLDALEDDLNVDIDVLKEKMKMIGYAYNKETNQFKPIK